MEDESFLASRNDWTNAASNAGLKDIFFEDEIVGGVADDKTPMDLAKKHKRTLRDIADEIKLGKGVEREHTKSDDTAEEIAMDHVDEFPEYYSDEEHGVLASEKAMEDELEESTTAGSSGAFTGLFNGGEQEPIKRTIHKSDVPVTVNGLTKTPISKINSFRKSESRVFKKNQLKESNVITKKEMLDEGWVDSIKDFFSAPKCKSCGEKMEDHGYFAGGLSNEPAYVCTNEDCGESDWYHDRKNRDKDKEGYIGGNAVGKPLSRKELKGVDDYSYKQPQMDESTDGGSYTTYDTPGGWGNNEFMGTKGKKGNAVQKKGNEHKKTYDYDTGSSTFVKIKDKCKKFPYCNQDANAIETSKQPFAENEEDEQLIENICKKTGKSKKYVHSLINRYL
jgi:hypothetical protein